MTASNTSLLYYFTPTYFGNLVINAFNKQYGSSYDFANFVIEQIPNDQNSRCAYELYPTDINSLLRIRVYCQLANEFSLSPFTIQDVKGDYESENATLINNTFSLPVIVSFDDAIQQDASLINSVFKADFKISSKAYQQYMLSSPNQCPPYGEYGNDVWVLGSTIENELIVDNNGNCLVIYTD